MENTKSKQTQSVTLEDLYLTKLSAKQLQTLLPCYRKDVEFLIKNRIKELDEDTYFDTKVQGLYWK